MRLVCCAVLQAMFAGFLEAERCARVISRWLLTSAVVSRAVSCCPVLQAMFAGFLEADKICQGRFKVSGTTATLAVVVGWEVFVANVGDSAAYLDTGKQVGGVCVFDGACKLSPCLHRECCTHHISSPCVAVTLAISHRCELLTLPAPLPSSHLLCVLQVICLTGNHRVDDNPAERERVIASGGECWASSAVKHQ
jgi:hypothetical protein